MSKPIEITAGKIETRTSNIAYSDGKFHNVEILWDSPPPTLVKVTSIPLGDSGASPATTVIIALSRLEDLVEKGEIHMIDIGDGLEEAAAIQTAPQHAPTVPRQFAGSPVEQLFRDGSVFLGETMRDVASVTADLQSAQRRWWPRKSGSPKGRWPRRGRRLPLPAPGRLTAREGGSTRRTRRPGQ